MKIRILIKKSFREIEFVFDNWEDAGNFICLAMHHCEEDVSFDVSRADLEEDCEVDDGR